MNIINSFKNKKINRLLIIKKRLTGANDVNISIIQNKNLFWDKDAN